MIRQSDGVSLTAIIGTENVFFLDGRLSREEVVRRLAEKILPQVSGIITDKALFARLAEVEKLNQVLESGFYIPHAKFPELDGFHAVLGISPEGFHDAATGFTVKVVLLLLSPHKPAFFQRHLNMLSLLSQTFQPELIEKLAALKDPAEVLALIKSK
ncbi:MAG TPA: PTS sugar transporter subunit IIA [Elusimicrobiales bacterium]|nr:PTS sugar transporter subunit IIA [Elusimicrobiales bacterium]